MSLDRLCLLMAAPHLMQIANKMKKPIENLAIIAGRGQIPSMILEKCHKEGIKYRLFLLSGERYEDESIYDSFNPIKLKYGEISKFLQIVKQEGIENLIMAGGVTKPDFKAIKVDGKSALLMGKILAKKILGDESVLDTVIKFFEKEGLNIVKIQDFLENIISQRGVFSSCNPSKDDLENIKIAKDAINHFSKFDVGQSLIVAQKQIIAIEAVEGTDKMIRRCKDLDIKYKDSAILVKMSKKNQSDKADLPTIGVETVQNCIESGIKGIAIQAKLTLVLEKEKVVDLANKNGVFIVVV